MDTRRTFLFKAFFASVAGLSGGLKAVGAALDLPTHGTGLVGAELADLSQGVRHVDLFLLMGQSNMRGRGVLPSAQEVNPKILMMHMADDQWYVARDPLHARVLDGSDNAGVGPGMSFGREVVARGGPDSLIGLIPCARGGSRIRLWQKGKGQSLYDNTIRRANVALAARGGLQIRVRAALWLQGESDSTEELYGEYEDNLLNVVDNLRTDLRDPQLPFIACTVGSFIEGHKTYTRTREVNRVLLGLPKKRPRTACVDARDLNGHIGDRVHFNTESQVIIGQRYGEKLSELVGM